jgi:hypothetical protein
LKKAFPHRKWQIALNTLSVAKKNLPTTKTPSKGVPFFETSDAFHKLVCPMLDIRVRASILNLLDLNLIARFRGEIPLGSGLV